MASRAPSPSTMRASSSESAAIAARAASRPDRFF
jgi:hypothetical protein